MKNKKRLEKNAEKITKFHSIFQLLFFHFLSFPVPFLFFLGHSDFGIIFNHILFTLKMMMFFFFFYFNVCVFGYAWVSMSTCNRDLLEKKRQKARTKQRQGKKRVKKFSFNHLIFTWCFSLPQCLFFLVTAFLFFKRQHSKKKKKKLQLFCLQLSVFEDNFFVSL